jgi:hypothetical protein
MPERGDSGRAGGRRLRSVGAAAGGVEQELGAGRLAGGWPELGGGQAGAGRRAGGGGDFRSVRTAARGRREK